MLKRRAMSLLFALLLCGFAGCSGCGPHTEDIKQATAAGDAWLKFIDQGNYDQAYAQTGAQFKKTIDKEAWVKQITPYRGALGSVGSRKVDSAEYSDSIPELESGQYVRLKYTTSFQHGPNSYEEVTVQKENDGVWRIMGYYVRFAR